MDDSILSQAIAQTFPDLDETMRKEVYMKVSAHILEVLKDKVYQDNPEGLASLNQQIENESDISKRSEMYGSQIIQGLQALSEEKQKEINQQLNEELVNVMHRIYQAYV